MIQKELEIVNKLGLHARAAKKFVDCTGAFSSTIQTGVDGDLIDGKSIMSVMLLAAGKGTVLDLQIEGDDEDDALAALTTLIENRFDEPE